MEKTLIGCFAPKYIDFIAWKFFFPTIPPNLKLTWQNVVKVGTARVHRLLAQYNMPAVKSVQD